MNDNTGTTLIVWSCLLLAGSSFGLTLDSVQKAAEHKGIPTRFFEDIKSEADGSVSIISKNIDLPRYYVFWNQIALSRAQYNQSPSKWSASEFWLFYNELFHAWWDVVFKVSPRYRQQYRALTKAYETKYRRANPSNPLVAMEEAYSETVSALTLLFANRVDSARFYYKPGFTVMEVSHYEPDQESFWSFLPWVQDGTQGYTAEADRIYPSELEYRQLFYWMTGTQPPDVPESR